MQAGVLVIAAMLAACWTGSEQPTTVQNIAPKPTEPAKPAPERVPTEGTPGHAVYKFERFKNAMCACADSACATKVTEEMTTWATEMSRTMGKDDRPDPALAKRMSAIGEAFARCMTAAMTQTP